MTDKDVITAGGIAPLEFAYDIFKRLDIFAADKLEAWYSLFKTCDISNGYCLAQDSHAVGRRLKR